MNKILQDDSLCPSPPAEMKLGGCYCFAGRARACRMRTGQGDLQMASQVGRSGRGQPQPSLILSLLKNLAGSPLDEAEADRLALNKQLKIHDLWRAPCRIRSQTKKTLSPAFFNSWRTTPAAWLASST